MTNKEKEYVRCLIANAGKVPPDTIRILVDVVDEEKAYTLYVLEEYNGYDIVLGFDYIPTFEEAREEIRDLYLMSLELELDNLI